MDNIVDKIMTELDEPNRPLVARIVRVLGAETAEVYLQRTLDLVAGGYEDARPRSPLLKRNGKPRSKGGTFIYLIRGEVSPEQKQLLWPSWRQQRPRPLWDVTEALWGELEEREKGAGVMWVELTGIPTKFSVRNTVTSAVFVVEPDEERIPEGLPLPPSSSTYLVLMQSIDYQGLAAEIKEGGKQLRVRGYCHINPEKGIGVVLAEEVEAVGAE